MGDDGWRNRKTLILGRTDMIGLLSPAEYNDRVEHAFRMHGLGRVYMEPKGHIVLDRYPGEWEVMPSYIEEPEAAACKWVSIREDNAKYGLPAVFSILVYTHPETGFPLAICDGSHHTLMRTGASAAVSAKWLARKDSDRARDRGHRKRRQGHARHLRCRLPFPRGARLEQDAGVARSFRGGGAAPLSAPRAQAVHGSRAGGARSRRRRDRDARAAAGSSTTAGSSRAPTSRPSGPISRASRSSTRASCKGQGLRRRHPAVHARRRDQRAAAGRADLGGSISPARSAR